MALLPVVEEVLVEVARRQAQRSETFAGEFLQDVCF
jgi:hypothetical protein